MSMCFIKIDTKKFSNLSFGFVFLVLNLFPFFAKSQDVKSLSLQETINLSLKNSHALKASLAKSAEAAAMLKQAEDNRLPNASVSGSYLYMANPNLAIKTKALGGGSDSTGNQKQIPHINQAMYGIFNVSLPIYAGGKIRYGIESAKYLQQAASFDAENDKEAVILNTINAYINLYK